MYVEHKHEAARETVYQTQYKLQLKKFSQDYEGDNVNIFKAQK